MQQKELANWFHDYPNPPPQKDEEEEEEEEWEEEPSWFEEPPQEKRFLDPNWYKLDRDVQKHIPKLTTIILGKIIKIVNSLATSGGTTDFV
jgi:hypothetical protein